MVYLYSPKITEHRKERPPSVYQLPVDWKTRYNVKQYLWLYKKARSAQAIILYKGGDSSVHCMGYGYRMADVITGHSSLVRTIMYLDQPYHYHISGNFFP